MGAAVERLLEGIVKLYYGIWKLILMIPLMPRLLCEVTIYICIVVGFWPLVKLLFWIVMWGLRLVNILILGGIRNLCCWFLCRNPRVYDWDDRIGKRGQRIEDRLDAKRVWLVKSKWKDLLKKKSFWLGSVGICLWVCLPWLQLEKYIDDFYLSPLYFGNKTVIAMETFFTKGIGNYPDLIIKQGDEASVMAAASEEPMEELVYLMLRENITYANVREKADLDSKEICSVSKADSIVYQNIYEFDSKRYWLKVIIESQNDKEGWISEKVIDQEILESLDLQ